MLGERIGLRGGECSWCRGACWCTYVTFTVEHYRDQKLSFFFHFYVQYLDCWESQAGVGVYPPFTLGSWGTTSFRYDPPVSGIVPSTKFGNPIP